MNPIDGYLLNGSPTKAEAIAAVLEDQAPIERAQPFYRALDVFGTGIADEALIALRLTLAGQTPDDAAIRSLRGFITAARQGDAQARAAYLAAVATPA